LACGSVLRDQHGAQLNDPFTTRACRAAVRSAEAMVADFAARGYDVSNAQPRQ
jgi:hypothetical protein